MHLAVPAATPLVHLDGFLRNIWLECCGHMSAFTIAGRRYADSPISDEGESGMRGQVGKLLKPGMVFAHVYDYGSTTELKLKVLGFRDRIKGRGPAELLARNDAPQIVCDECGSLATAQICSECDSRGEGWLCEACAAKHECGEEMLLPVVNSPRAGVCGYAG